jgi:hypothetical protein
MLEHRQPSVMVQCCAKWNAEVSKTTIRKDHQ